MFTYRSTFSYRELRKALETLEDEWLDSDVIICGVDGEYHAAQLLCCCDGVLDDGHPVLVALSLES